MKVAYLDVSGGSRRITIEGFYEGTAVVYIAEGHEATCLQCDFELEPRVNSRKSEVRAVRERKRRRGEKSPRLPESRIRDRLAIICGSEMSHAEVIQTLQALLERIKRQGLLIGLDEAGNSVEEGMDGKITVRASKKVA